jgi:hypothetical protein
MKNIRYLMMENMEAGAIVSGLGIRYLYSEMPLITLNHKDDMVKISARGTKPLISKGLDLSVAMRKAAEAVGGAGGSCMELQKSRLLPPAHPPLVHPPTVMQHDPGQSGLLGREGGTGGKSH